MEEQRPTLNERLTAYEIVDFDCGANHCVALTKGGIVLTWGLGTEQNAALGTNWEPDAVRKIPNPVRLTHLTERYGNIVQVVATNDASFALTEQGYVLGWGCFKVCVESPPAVSPSPFPPFSLSLFSLAPF